MKIFHLEIKFTWGKFEGKTFKEYVQYCHKTGYHWEYIFWLIDTIPHYDVGEFAAGYYNAHLELYQKKTKKEMRFFNKAENVTLYKS